MRDENSGGMRPPGRRRRKMQRVTMVEVAHLAEVSPSTVSLYLRKPEDVSAATGAQIARAIETLGYVPNLMAGGLAAASSRVVSIVVPSIRNAFFAETVATMQAALAAQGMQLLLGHSEYSHQQEEALVRAALSWAPAAIVLTGLDHGANTRRMLDAADVAVFEIWELGGRPMDVAVGFSHHAVGTASARHLIGRGRHRIAFLGARMQEDRRASQRADGFRSCVAEEGWAQPPVLNHPGPASAEAGALLLGRALDAMPDLDGVVCSNDLVALGVLFECQRRGIAVPERLAVVGFGDLAFAASCVPPLTTIRPSGDIIGQEVARLIAERIDTPGSKPEARVIDTGFSLIERKSA